MNFAHPLALLLLVLLVPVALVYWLPVRLPDQAVGTGLFWQMALAEEKARWRWRRWRTKVSLAVQMLIVVLIALAAAGPQMLAPRQIVLILDNSATMRATDVPPTRLDAAKDAARRMVESLRPGEEMAVVTVGPVPRDAPGPKESQPLTTDRALLTAAIDDVQASDEPAAIELLVKLARMIPAPENVPPRIVLITDACAREATKRAEASGVEVLRVGTPAGNVAIAAFTARRSLADPTKCQVFVDMRNHSDQSAQVALTIASFNPEPAATAPSASFHPEPGRPGAPAERVGGVTTASKAAGREGGFQPVATSRFLIAANGRWQHVFTFDLPAAARLIARVEPSDAYPFDNTAVLDVPAAPPRYRVKLDRDERSCLEEILAADPRVVLVEDDLHYFEGRSRWKDEVICPTLVVGGADCPRPSSEGDGIRQASDLAALAPCMARGRMEDAMQQIEHLSYACRPTQRDGADIRVPRDIGSEALALSLPEPRPPLWLVPAAMAAVLLTIEWCLYQRRWTD